MTSPTAAFSPLCLSIWVMVPAAGAGSSTVAFSVSITTTGSSWSTDSPGFLSQSPISTSLIDSPTEGTTNSTAMFVTYMQTAIQTPLQSTFPVPVYGCCENRWRDLRIADERFPGTETV